MTSLTGRDIMDRPTRVPRLIFPALGGFYDRVEPISYALLRVGFGLTMATHGFPKLLGTSHGSMADPMAGSTNLIANVLGLPFAPQLALFVAVLEALGGLMVAAGLLTRVLAPMMAIQMVALSYVLGPTYPWIDRGIEYPLILGLIAFFISMRGGGPASLDRRIGTAAVPAHGTAARSQGSSIGAKLGSTDPGEPEP